MPVPASATADVPIVVPVVVPIVVPDMYKQPQIHVQNGLFFRRLRDGSVRIIKTADGLRPTPAKPLADGTVNRSNVIMDETIDAQVFLSIVKTVASPEDVINALT